MKTKRTRRIITAALALVLLCGVAVAAGTVKTQQIEANYMDIKLVVDGIEVTPRDAAGKEVEPFASEGTTYLPVRAVANALGKDVEWDGANKTIYIGPRPGQTESWMKKLPPYQVGSSCGVYDGSDPKAYFTVGGVKHTEGVWLNNGLYRGNAAHALWNTNLQYGTMTFKVGHVDGSEALSTKLEVYLDGELSREYDLAWDGPIQTITIPLNYSANVKLKLADDGYWDEYSFGLFDIAFGE